MLADTVRARDALQAIPPDLPRDEWVRAGMAAQAAGLTFADFDDWSVGASNYNERGARAAWNSFKTGKGVGAGTLFMIAARHGWQTGDQGQAMMPVKVLNMPGLTSGGPRPAMAAADVWKRCKPATAAHGYIEAKQGTPEGLRVVAEGDSLRVAGVPMAGALVVPVLPLDGGEPASLQFIAAPAQAAEWKAAGRPGKLNLPGTPMAGVFIVGDMVLDGAVFVVEGIGQAWACWKATGTAAVVCFGWGRVRGVAAELRQRDGHARLILVPDAGKEAEAEVIAREVGAEFVTMPQGSTANFDASDYAQAAGFDALEMLLTSTVKPAEPEPAPMPFAVVQFGDLATTDPVPPHYVWDGLVPAGHVTMLAAHGGTGKSMVALMLAVSVALGLSLFGIPTRKGIAAFYSGEDGAGLLRYRLQLVCRCLGVNVDDLAGRLFILDATDNDPTLYAEAMIDGHRGGATTPTYDGLREFIALNGVSLLVVDNASDAFDASEIDRARVRGFMRVLAHIARERDAGVLLLAHVDKVTSRGDRGQNSEGYSGSTAWHNSARSRLFMSRDKAGGLLLEHQKHNLGSLHEPLRLVWPDGGIPQADEAFGPVVQGIADRGQTKALLKLIVEFTERGEFVTTATTSRTHAAKLLHQESAYPKLKDGEVFNLLRQSERAGQLQRVTFKGADRKDRERWEVTASGAEWAGIPKRAATAATAATSPLVEVTAPSAEPAKPAATAATSLPGGVGERAPQEVTAQLPAGGADA